MPLSVSHVEGCPDLGPECALSPAPTPYWHYVDELIAETALGAKLAVSDWFAVETRWALRVVDVNPTYGELDGTPKNVPGEIHHHDETLVDLSDPWFVASFSAATSGWLSTAKLGLTLPLGRTEEDPYALGEQGKSHQHIQGGTGTVLPILGFDLAYTIARASPAPVTLGLDGTALVSLYANGKGYQAPTRFDVGHRVAVTLFDGRLTPALSLRITHDGEEYWNGDVGGEGTTVKTELFVGGALAWRFHDRWWLAAAMNGRVASLSEAHTFESVGTFSLSAGTTFDLWDTDDERRARGEHIDERGIRRIEEDGAVEFVKE